MLRNLEVIVHCGIIQKNIKYLIFRYTFVQNVLDGDINQETGILIILDVGGLKSVLKNVHNSNYRIMI